MVKLQSSAASGSGPPAAPRTQARKITYAGPHGRALEINGDLRAAQHMPHVPISSLVRFPQKKNLRSCRAFSMAAGVPPLLRALALPILGLCVQPAMDSSSVFAPPAAYEEGRPTAEAPPVYYYLVSSLTSKKSFRFSSGQFC
jgi:hypothetical protein